MTYSRKYFQEHLDWYENMTRFCTFRLENVFNVSLPEKGERILDLGCGIGTFSLEASKYGADVIGIDNSPIAIEMAKETAKKYELNTDFRIGSITKLDFPDNTFDKVYWAGIIEHISKEDYNLLLKETARVLKHNGELIVEAPTSTHFSNMFIQDSTHIDYKDLNAVATDLEEEGFTIKIKKHLPTHIPVLNIVEKSLIALPLFQKRFVILAIKPDIHSLCSVCQHAVIRHKHSLFCNIMHCDCKKYIPHKYKHIIYNEAQQSLIMFFMLIICAIAILLLSPLLIIDSITRRWKRFYTKGE